MQMSSSRISTLLDQAAVALSGVCLLHCLALPLMLAALPVFGGLRGEHFHLQLLLVVVPVSLIAFALGFRRHRDWRVISLGLLGIMLLTAGGTVVHNSYGIIADTLFTVAGALVLAGAHYFNGRLRCRRVQDPAAAAA